MLSSLSRLLAAPMPEVRASAAHGLAAAAVTLNRKSLVKGWLSAIENDPVPEVRASYSAAVSALG